MSIVDTDLKLFLAGTALIDTDAETTGGAISLVRRPELTQWSAAAIAEVVSDGADTRTVTVTGRLPNGAISSDPIVLNGTTPVAGAVTFERVLAIVLSTTDASRTVQVKQGAAGTVRATIVPDETDRALTFINSESDPAVPVIRFEKLFWQNDHATLALLGAEVELVTDADALFEIGLAAAVNDTATIANRLAAPGGITFVDDGVAQAVPGTDLDAQDHIGVWVKQTLAAAEPAGTGTYTVQITGSSV